MKKQNRKSILGALLVTAALSAGIAFAAEKDDRNLSAEAQETISNFQKRDSTLKEFFDTSAGYVVFPSVGKGGFVVGGAHGTGLVYEKGKMIGKAKMTQASVGAQVGGQTFSEVIFFETPAALADFKDGKYEMSAEASAVAAAEGAARTARYKQGVAVFALPKKGLMAQASVGGQKFKFEPLDTAIGAPGTSKGTSSGTQKND